MDATMMEYPLTVTQIFRHGQQVHGDREVISWTGGDARRASFAEVGERAERLARGLGELGVGPGDVVGTFCWNHQEHLEAYFAVPCMGAVLHTLNIRLFPEQLAYVVDHAGDKVVIIDDSLIPLYARVVDDIASVQTYVVVGDGDASALGDRHVVRYDDLLAANAPGFDWPQLDERSPAAACYTSGTTGNPKGVVYSHRSQWCHTMGAAAGGLAVGDRDTLLMIVPMFHANAWGLPYIAWAHGANILQPERYLQPEPLVAMIEQEKPTFAAAVPTVWNGVLQLGATRPIDLSSLRSVVVGGSAVPRQMIKTFRDDYGVEIIQGWGMTETSPLGAMSFPPAGVEYGTEEELDWRAKTGRIVCGVDLRITDENGVPQPWDGKSIGEIEVRGPWITGRYAGVEPDPEKFRDGWLRTGDMATVEPNGFIQIVDRTKDVIKSGGEWVSSVDLENQLMAHPEVVEAAVIGVPDEKWDERPCACVVRAEGSSVGPADLAAFLADRVAKWWIPERWTFIDEVPKTSVGKFDKKVLRARYAAGELSVETLDS
ncbi:MAG: fatty-acid--CoA ligase [Actinomyces sp.]|nr:MAG: fatty-acid--CoA ligase [Actinomyces sp.]